MRLFACLLVVGMCSMLSGCGGGQWTHPTKTAQDFQRDKFDCENVIVTKHGGWANVEPFTASYEIRQCLEVKGYQLASK